MRIPRQHVLASVASAGARLCRFLRDVRGTTAIEFGMVAGPFLIFSFSVAGMGLYWLATTQLSHAVQAASRDIRTGEAQRTNITADDFKNNVCDRFTTFLACDQRLQVHVQSFDRWADAQPVNCIQDDGTGLRQRSGNGSDSITLSAGDASQVVMVTLCYEFELARSMPWLFLAAKDQNGNEQLAGSALIRSSTAFRTEPYQ